jgi:hypothetical protein
MSGSKFLNRKCTTIWGRYIGQTEDDDRETENVQGH